LEKIGLDHSYKNKGRNCCVDGGPKSGAYLISEFMNNLRICLRELKTTRLVPRRVGELPKKSQIGRKQKAPVMGSMVKPVRGGGKRGKRHCPGTLGRNFFSYRKKTQQR